MKKVLLILIICNTFLILLTTTGCQQSKDDSVWQSLFDGKTLSGWQTLPGGTWEVQNGTIVGRSPEQEKRHGILLTEKRYRDFKIRLQFKVLKGNSGLYFRVDTVASGVSVNGFQAEIDEYKDIGGLYETGGRAWVVQPSPEKVKEYFKVHDWNEMTVTAIGGHITVNVNDVKTSELKDDPGRLDGFIGLQLHGSMEMHVMFKDIEIQVL
jgi:hypothetical protein